MDRASDEQRSRSWVIDRESRRAVIEVRRPSGSAARLDVQYSALRKAVDWVVSNPYSETVWGTEPASSLEASIRRVEAVLRRRGYSIQG